MPTMATTNSKKKLELPPEDDAARGVKDPSKMTSSRRPTGRDSDPPKKGRLAAARTQPIHSRVVLTPLQPSGPGLRTGRQEPPSIARGARTPPPWPPGP